MLPPRLPSLLAWTTAALLLLCLSALCLPAAAQASHSDSTLTTPSFLPNSGVVLSPQRNATLKLDGGLVHIRYNGIAAEGFTSTRLEVYLLTTSNGLSPADFSGNAPSDGSSGSSAASARISGYQRLGSLSPLAQLPPNAYQAATPASLRAARQLNAYDYAVPLPVNTQAGRIDANLTLLELYHSPDDQGLVWASLVYHPVVVDATPQGGGAELGGVGWDHVRCAIAITRGNAMSD